MGLARPVGAGAVQRQPLATGSRPGIEEWLHRLPAGLDAVGALEQDVVADHAVVDQGLIAGAGRRPEVILVLEAHFHAVDRHRWPRHLGVELQGDAFGRLDPDHQVVLRQPLHLGGAEHRERRLLEANCHFRALRSQGLASAQIERHAGPAPVVDGQLHRRVGFCDAGGIDIRGVAIVPDLLVAVATRHVLSADGVVERLFGSLDLDGGQHFALFRTHRVRIEPRRRFHSDQRQQLKQMVRHHVAHGTGRVIEAAAAADINGFRHGDLDMIDVIAIPDRLEHAVGEAEHQDVLHRLFAEIVVDAIDLVLVDDLEQVVVELPRGRQIGAERLFDHQSPPGVVLLMQQAGAPQFLADRFERGRRHRQVEQVVLDAALGEAVEVRFQPLERTLFAGVRMHGADAVEQLLGDIIVDRAGGELLQSLHQVVVQRLALHFGAGDADHAEIVGQQPRLGQVVQRRCHQAVGEVAGDAEDHEAAGLGDFRLGGTI